MTLSSQATRAVCSSPLDILDINLPPTPTPHNITSPLALPIQRQISRFPLALILTSHTLVPTPTIHNLNLPIIINIISPRNRLPQFPPQRPNLSLASSRNKHLRFHPPRFEPPLLADRRPPVQRDGSFHFDDDFVPLTLSDGTVVFSNRLPGVAARSQKQEACGR